MPKINLGNIGTDEFQSYQFRQINPDLSGTELTVTKTFGGFNRINSGRSIPTCLKEKYKAEFEIVSIVSIQADQSRHDYQSVHLI